MHRFASFTFANDSSSLTSADNNTPPMFSRAIARTTSKKLDFDNEEDDSSLSNASPVIMKESLTNLFLKKDNRKGAVSLQGNFPRATGTLLNLEDDSEAPQEQRKPESETRSLLLPRFGSSGDIQMENKDAEISESPSNKAKKTISQSLFSQSPQNSQQKASTENQDLRAEKSTSNGHSQVDDSLAKDFAIKLSLSINKNSRDPDLNTISPQTTAKLIHESSASDYLIIDCRYDYEFQGGHIKDAINILCPKVLEEIFITNKQLLYNPVFVQDLKKDLKRTLANTESYSNDVLSKDLPLIIFHCEFSQKRGPRAFRNLRSKDRAANIANFPHIDYPQIYVLEGGYCNFYPQFPELCEGGYVTMIDEEFSMEYAKSKQYEKKCWNKKSFTDLNLLDLSD